MKEAGHVAWQPGEVVAEAGGNCQELGGLLKQYTSDAAFL